MRVLLPYLPACPFQCVPSSVCRQLLSARPTTLLTAFPAHGASRSQSMHCRVEGPGSQCLWEQPQSVTVMGALTLRWDNSKVCHLLEVPNRTVLNYSEWLMLINLGSASLSSLLIDAS